MINRLLLLALTLGLTAMPATISAAAAVPVGGDVASAIARSPHYHAGTFHNAQPVHKPSLGENLALFWTVMFKKSKATVPTGVIPVDTLSRAQLQAAPDDSVFRLGHSTMLLKFGGLFYLTDPVFSRRASPVQWAGPARFHQPPIAIADVPPIAAVILSHDHYDHLDRASVLALAPITRHFITPLGVGERLIAWGIDAAKVRQLDWWHSTEVGAVTLVATPARHFSGRTPSDRDRTLWASWVIQHGDLKLFFSGDTGYFDGFQQIGAAYGPFNLAMLETGAYDALWPDVHMQPEQTLQAFLDLKGKTLMPIHNGTFDLGLHRWQEPFERIHALATASGVAITTPRMGERLDVRQPAAAQAWWNEVDRLEGVQR